MQLLFKTLVLIGTLSFSLTSEAQKSQDFGEYVVHYNALNTNLLTPQVAQGYGIRRSSNRALLNLAVLKQVAGSADTPVNASITATGTNLTGQKRDIDIRKIDDSEGAIYYLGEFPVHNLETYRFDIRVNVEGEDEEFVVKFNQQFYTE
jgi:hypothetical protein